MHTLVQNGLLSFPCGDIMEKTINIMYTSYPLARYVNFAVLTTLAVAFFYFYVGIQFAYAETGANLCPYAWTQNMKMGSTGETVLKLQQFLNTDSDTMVAASGVGSAGNETGFYGALTAKAVTKFQEKYKTDILSPIGLQKGTGSALGLTRAKLNALCISALQKVSGEETSPAEEIDALTITVPAQPPSLIAPSGAWTVPFTNFVLEAGSQDVTIRGIVVRRGGAGADGAFTSIVLTDENRNYIGRYKGLRSDHTVELGEEFVIPAHESQMITVMGNMVADVTEYDGQKPVLEVIAINASSPIVGDLPIRGTAQTVNSTLLIGGATALLSQFDPATASNRYISDTGIRFSGIRITANANEPLRFNSITWDQVGTAGASDLANVVTVINDVAYPTEIDGRYYTSTFEPPIIIPKGESVDLYVRGDITTSGANRTVQFNIRKSDGVWLTGDTYGFDVSIAAEANTATEGNSVFITSDGTTDGDEGTPFFSGSVVTINGATVTSIGR